MMRFKKILLAAAAVSMAASPVVAAAQTSAAKLSVVKSSSVPASARASATDGKSKLRGGFLIPAIAIVAIILGILAATGGDDRPDSP